MTKAVQTGAEPILRVDNLHLAYDKTPVLAGVSMSLQRGQVVSLLGPSGSGKTTLLRAVAGLEAPQTGRIVISGRTIYDSASGTDVPAERRELGLVFQSYALWPHMTVADNVGYPLRLRKVGQAEIRERVDAILRQLSLGHLGDRFPHQLSGGQQQRVSIARALVYNPPVILLDEPLSNLDAKLREEARAWLRDLIVDLQLSALVVTHDQSEAMAMSDRILLLNGGRIEQEGTPQSMYEQPASRFVADFLGSNNVLPGQVVGISGEMAEVELPDGQRCVGRRRSQAGVGDTVSVVCRVERLRLSPATGGQSALHASLRTSMFLGERYEHLLHLDQHLLRAWGPQALPPGPCVLQVAPDDLWVF